MVVQLITIIFIAIQAVLLSLFYLLINNTVYILASLVLISKRVALEGKRMTLWALGLESLPPSSHRVALCIGSRRGHELPGEADRMSNGACGGCFPSGRLLKTGTRGWCQRLGPKAEEPDTVICPFKILGRISSEYATMSALAAPFPSMEWECRTHKQLLRFENWVRVCLISCSGFCEELGRDLYCYSGPKVTEQRKSESGRIGRHPTRCSLTKQVASDLVESGWHSFAFLVF